MSEEQHDSTVESEQLTSPSTIEIQPVRSMTCYICLENIATTHKKFGLQNNCDHVFCFDCLSTWRRTGAMIDNDTGRRCPLCRTRSTFIAPSRRCFNDAEDKQSLIDAHRTRLKKLPCQTLARYNFCRFGRRCYYSHHIPFLYPLTETWSSSSVNLLPSVEEHEPNLSFTFQSNPIESIHEEEPPRRITFNAYRYRPY